MNANKVVYLSIEDAQRIAMVVNDARLRLKDRPIDRMRRPAIESACAAIDTALNSALDETKNEKGDS